MSLHSSFTKGLMLLYKYHCLFKSRPGGLTGLGPVVGNGDEEDKSVNCSSAESGTHLTNTFPGWFASNLKIK